MNDSMRRLGDAIKETGEHVKRQEEILRRIRELNASFLADDLSEPIVGGDGSV